MTELKRPNGDMKLDRQAVLEATTMAIVTQGGPSMRGPRCIYRSENGRKCAIGHLILDEHYDAKLESLTVMKSPVLRALRKSLPCKLQAGDIEFLNDLQHAHDNATAIPDSFWKHWARGLEWLCGQYDLRFPEEYL